MGLPSKGWKPMITHHATIFLLTLLIVPAITRTAVATQTIDVSVFAAELQAAKYTTRKRASFSRHHRKQATGSTALKGPSARRGYKKVSDLVNFPSFFPGIGVLYVKPNTLPNGPFLAFDRKDRLVSTIYMIPLEEMENHKTFENLAGFAGRGDHVTLYFNGGHPGVDMPHYHIVIWHVSKKDEARVAK